MSKTARDIDLPLILDPESSEPLYVQLRDQIAKSILSARLKPGTRLPSTRHLAEKLGVSRIVTVAAYDDLYGQGYIESRQGSGTFVTSMQAIRQTRKKEYLPPVTSEKTAYKISFEPGYADSSL